MKIIIEEITEWTKDNRTIEGDLGHGSSESDVLLALAEETKLKKESEWTKGLPFVWEQDVERDLDDGISDLLDDALDQYSDRYCAADYLKPVKFGGRVEGKVGGRVMT